MLRAIRYFPCFALTIYDEDKWPLWRGCCPFLQPLGHIGCSGQSVKGWVSVKFGKTTCIGVVWLENAEVITGSESGKVRKVKTFQNDKLVVLIKYYIYIGKEQTDRNVSAMREIENSDTILVKNMKWKHYFEALAIDGSIISKSIWNKYVSVSGWSSVSSCRQLRGQYNADNFLTSWTTSNFSGITLQLNDKEPAWLCRIPLLPRNWVRVDECVSSYAPLLEVRWHSITATAYRMVCAHAAELNERKPWSKTQMLVLKPEKRLNYFQIFSSCPPFTHRISSTETNMFKVHRDTTAVFSYE